MSDYIDNEAVEGWDKQLGIQIVMEYNNSMGGADLTDPLISTWTFTPNKHFNIVLYFADVFFIDNAFYEVKYYIISHFLSPSDNFGNDLIWNHSQICLNIVMAT